MSIRSNLLTTPETQGDSRVDSSQIRLSDFWNFTPEERHRILIKAIHDSHEWHYQKNRSYWRTLSGRGVPKQIQETDFPTLVRPTAQTFKSYIDLLGTPFPQDQPKAFLQWLDDQLSIELPQGRFPQFRARYPSLEAFLQAIEAIYADLHLEISTSSGTSGRSTIMVRDEHAIQLTVESFQG